MIWSGIHSGCSLGQDGTVPCSVGKLDQTRRDFINGLAYNVTAIWVQESIATL